MSSITDHLSHLFGEKADADALAKLAALAHQTHIPAGTKLFASGDACENFVIIAAGQARVKLSTKSGREVTLFKLDPGQSCALTTSCLLSNTPYYAEGVAETDVDMITIPSAGFHQALASSPHLMQILLSDYAHRIAGLTALVDRLTSRDLNIDLAEFLLQRADRERQIHLSHKQIADELRTAREVISRKLKDWERSGWVTLKRGIVLIDNKDALQRLLS